MIQKSDKSKKQPVAKPQKSRKKKSPVQKSAGNKRALQSGLQMNEGGFKQLLEAIPDGLVIVNALGKIQFINKQVEEMFGYQSEEMLGKPVELLVPDRFSSHKENREGYLNNLHSRPMGGGLDLFAVRKDGTEFRAEISLSPLEIEGELYIIAAIRDITQQRLSEKQHTQSLARYRQTLDNMMEGCQIIDFDWRYIYVNNVAAIQGQTRPENLLMRTMMDVYPGIENTELFAVLRHCMEERISRRMENRFENPDGSIGWFKLSIQPVPEGIFVLSIDDTERKQAEASLLESIAQFRTLFEASPDAIVLIDPHNNWTVFDCNTAACQMNGYTRDELIGQSIDILNLEPGPPSERADYLEQIRRIGVLHVDTFHRRKDGSVFSVEVSTSIIMLSGREMILGIDRDITERKQAEALLVQSEKRFKALIEKSMEEVSMVSADGTLLFESPTTRRPLGYPPDTFLGHSIFEVFHPEDRPHAAKLFEQVIKQPGNHVEASFRAQHSNGSWRWIEGVVTNMLDDPAVQAVVINYRDVTERKQAEEELFQSEERYRTLFEDSPISLWEEDFSTVKQRIEGLRQQGITDFQSYFSSHPEVVAEYIGLVQVVDVNKAALKLYQAQGKKDLIDNLADVLDPSKLEHFQEELICVAEGRSHYNWEGPEKTLTGERIDVRINWIIAPGHEEDLSNVIVSIIDLTERKQAEEALNESKLLFHHLIESLPQNIYAKDVEGRFVFANQHYCATQGRPLEEIVGKTDYELHLPELAEKYSMDDRHVMKTGQTLELIEEHQSLGDKRFYVQVIKTPLYDSKGQTAGTLGIFWDITERMQTEEEIRTRTKELQTLYELSRALANADDLDEILNQVNRHAVGNVHTTFARIALLEGNQLLMRAVYPVRFLDHDLLTGKREPLAMLPYCQHVLEQNKSVILGRNNNQEVTRYEKAALLLDFAQSMCLIPLQIGNSGLGSKKQTLGLLMLGETRGEGREPFTPAKIRLSESIGDQAASAIRRMLLYEQTERRLQHLTALRKIDQSITSSSSLYASLGIVLSQVVEQLRADAASIWLFNPVSNMLEYSVGRGFYSNKYEQEEKPLRLGEGYAGRAALEHSTVHISNLAAQDNNPRLKQVLAFEAFVSYYAVPLIAKGSIKGVMEVFQRAPLEPDEEWLSLMDTLAGQAAIAIDNATLFENLQNSNADLMEAYDTTLEGWSAALDLRDKETEGHTQRVTKLTLRLAESMGFNQQQQVHVRRGALLHDIGKMGVPDRILLKPDKLDDEEWVIMRKHPVYAYELLKGITYLGQALDIPYCHHEKWDGTGYPRRLKGEEIPFAARIFAVVDIYDALTSDRPYRQGWTHEKTLDHIRGLSGNHLEPQVVEAFLKMDVRDE